jgi:hypothetical protein
MITGLDRIYMSILLNPVNPVKNDFSDTLVFFG